MGLKDPSGRVSFRHMSLTFVNAEGFSASRGACLTNGAAILDRGCDTTNAINTLEYNLALGVLRRWTGGVEALPPAKRSPKKRKTLLHPDGNGAFPLESCAHRKVLCGFL